ncbi:MAG: DNA repair protein RecN [Oscillospiraceae bacterium]|nr:DNA repair protein RecN [Oscillospiraceae bacterium]
MLQLLHIENIAIIERADIAFARGFNALTGETGAGKSIVIDSLGAVLGQRTSRDLIRTGAPKAFVSAAFDDVDANIPALAENGVAPEEDGTLLLQRELSADGKNVCRVNGRPITVAQLKSIGASLLNIHGQHEGTQLLDETQHLIYLDRFAHMEPRLEAYGALYDTLRETRREIEALQMDEAEKARRVDTLRHQIAELERAELKEGEEEALLARRNILRNSEKFIAAISEADYCLNGGDENGGAAPAIKQAGDAIHSLRALGDEFIDLSERLEALYSEAYDLAMTVRDKREEFDFSPEELDAVESRADLLYRLKKKYGGTVEEMLEYLARSKDELDRIEYAGDRIAQLEKKLNERQAAVAKAAKELSGARKSAAKTLEAEILRELAELDMPKVRFAIDFTEKEPDATGMDEVRFLMSANVGEELRPIHKIASGGELARIMLALKNVFASQESIMTMVFDEVDTGVSGRAAQRVAEKLAKVSREKQVLCVTHLPQLAAMADTHFSVEKGEENGRTLTKVTELDHAARAKELARLTGGESISETMLRGAEELLDGAEAYKKTLAGGRA